MNGYLLYHSKLKTSRLGGITIYHDYSHRNQDLEQAVSSYILSYEQIEEDGASDP